MIVSGLCLFSVSLTSCGADFLEQRTPTRNTVVLQAECALHETVKSLQLYRRSTY